MSSTTTHGETPNPPAPIEFWDKQTVVEFFGGSRPLSIATLYRGMANGVYPRPVKTSANCARWIADECRATAQRMIAARDEPPTKPERRGRPRRRIEP